MPRTTLDLPALPLAEWVDTKETLHLFLQIVGKTRMALHPKLNHWWHVTLYPSPRGLTTGRIPGTDRDIEIAFDFLDHRLRIGTSMGDRADFALPGLSVAAFYRQFFGSLKSVGVEAAILARPYDRPYTTPFAEDEDHASYDTDAVGRYWQILREVAAVFETFRGRFIGKSTPVHLYWHSMDLALTRFSGKATPREGGTQADREAYSHEVISVGFWAGDDQVQEPAFYSYTYPEPTGLAGEKLLPKAALWAENQGSHTAFLPYEAIRTSTDPQADLFAFCQSAYEAGAKRAGWPRADLDTPWAST